MLNVGGGTPATGTPEKAENGSAKRGGWPKGKKRKKLPRDQTAPRQPLTGKKIFRDCRYIIMLCSVGTIFTKYYRM